jgi:hypothetical protein
MREFQKDARMVVKDRFRASTPDTTPSDRIEEGKFGCKEEFA